MELLAITNNPERASFRQRIGIYIESLVKNGINVHIEKLPSSVNERRKLYKHTRDYDCVFLHKKVLNIIDAFLLRKYAKKIIFNYDDAIMYSDKEPDKNKWSHLIPFRRTVRLADMVIVGSSYLADHAVRYNNNVRILPIGLKVGDYKLSSPPKSDDKIRLVWIGSKGTLSFLERIRPVLEEIGSRFDNVILRIICDDFIDLQNMSVEKCVWSEKTRVSDLTACDVGLAPLPDDRFTRGKCSFKVLEYSAIGLPVIASPIGTNADHVLDGKTGFLATEIQDWTDKITKLITDPELRKEMGISGQSYAKSHDIDIIGGKLAELIKQV